MLQTERSGSLAHRAALAETRIKPAHRMLLAMPLLLVVGALLVARSETWRDQSCVWGMVLLFAAVVGFAQVRASLIDHLAEAAASQDPESIAAASCACDALIVASAARELGDEAMRRLPPPYLA